MADSSPNRLHLYLKIGLIVISAVVTVSCLLGSLAYDWWASRISEHIVEFQMKNPSTTPDERIMAATKLLEVSQQTAHEHGATLFELFTHVLTGFLGIAIAALADVVGMKVGAESPIPVEPSQVAPVK